jgi:hypothetical protein
MTVEIEEEDTAKKALVLASTIIDGKYWELKTAVKTT